MNPDTRERLERLLVKTGTASAETVAVMRDEVPRAIGSSLVEEHGCDREKVLQVLAEVYRLPAVYLPGEQTDAELVDGLSPELCLRCMAAPLRMEDGHAIVAFADPEDLNAVDDIQAALGKPIQERVALASDILHFFSDTGGTETVQQIVGEILDDKNGEAEEDGPPVRRSTQSEARMPAVKLLDELTEEAVQRGAMHMYFVPFDQKEVRVRLCVERRIIETRRYPTHLHTNVVNRIRLLCDLVGKDKRVPQQGAYQTLIENEKHRVDVMIVPSVTGDAVTLFIDQEGLVSGDDVPKKRGCPQCKEPILPKWVYCPQCGVRQGESNKKV